MRLSVLGLLLALATGLVATANGALDPEIAARLESAVSGLVGPLAKGAPFAAALSTPFLAVGAVLALFVLARLLGWLLSLAGAALVILLMTAMLAGPGLGAFLAAAYPWAARGS